MYEAFFNRFPFFTDHPAVAKAAQSDSLSEKFPELAKALEEAYRELDRSRLQLGKLTYWEGKVRAWPLEPFWACGPTNPIAVEVQY